MSIVLCDDLAKLIAPHPDRVAVLILVRGSAADAGGWTAQLVTYGKTADDKVEAHSLKEWVKRQMYDDPPKPVVHESFILDAAKNREALDCLRFEAAAVLLQLDDLARVWGDEGVYRRCRDRLRAALAAAKTGEVTPCESK